MNENNNYNSEYNLIKQQELSLTNNTSVFINNYIQSKIDIITATAEEISELELNIKNTKISNKLRLGSKAGKFAAVYIGFEKNGTEIDTKSPVSQMQLSNLASF